jgi:hypothetical protein
MTDGSGIIESIPPAELDENKTNQYQINWGAGGYSKNKVNT